MVARKRKIQINKEQTVDYTVNKRYVQFYNNLQQEVKVIWQKAPHGGPIPRLGVTPGGRKLYHW